MQTWHCIVIIILSIAGFIYVSFLDDVFNQSDASLQQLMLENKESPNLASHSNNQTSSMSWAEISLILESRIAEEYALSFHEEVLDSKKFISGLVDALEKSQIAKNLILSPFVNEILGTNEEDILSSLISVKPRSPNSLEIICKGHSVRSANLLSELIIRIYNQLVTSDSSDAPLPQSLSEKLAQFKELESQINDLKVSLQEEFSGSPVESIHVMAIRSEIMQVEDEVNQIKKHLLRIDQIHRNKLNPTEYLHIAPIRDFGRVSQLGDILKQLKSMRLDQNINEFTRNQVEKNILATSKDLESEVVNAIETIKQDVAQLLLHKKDLQQEVFDHLEVADTTRLKTQHLSRLNKLKEQASQNKKEFEDANLLWIASKSSYSLFRLSN